MACAFFFFFCGGVLEGNLLQEVGLRCAREVLFLSIFLGNDGGGRVSESWRGGSSLFSLSAKALAVIQAHEILVPNGGFVEPFYQFLRIQRIPNIRRNRPRIMRIPYPEGCLQPRCPLEASSHYRHPDVCLKTMKQAIEVLSKTAGK